MGKYRVEVKNGLYYGFVVDWLAMVFLPITDFVRESSLLISRNLCERLKYMGIYKASSDPSHFNMVLEPMHPVPHWSLTITKRSAP